MARKAIVDKNIILNRLKDGETTQSIAENFNVSRQAIDLYRRDFIKKGLLPNQRAMRTRKLPKEATPKKQKLISPRHSLPSKDMVSLDEQIDLIIDAFNALKRLPELEKELEIYKRKYENATNEIEHLQNRGQKRQDQELRWLITHQDKGVGDN